VPTRRTITVRARALMAVRTRARQHRMHVRVEAHRARSEAGAGARTRVVAAGSHARQGSLLAPRPCCSLTLATLARPTRSRRSRSPARLHRTGPTRVAPSVRSSTPTPARGLARLSRRAGPVRPRSHGSHYARPAPPVRSSCAAVSQGFERTAGW
jgi:hypothetical protein